jgi:hypothetical protein
MATYDQMLRTFKAELDMSEKYKKDMVVKLALQLEKEGQIAVDKINQQLTEDLKGFITKAWIGQVLERKYKNGARITKGPEYVPNETKLLVKLGESGIETTEKDINDEIARLEGQTSNDFHTNFKKELDNRTIGDLNEEVFKELQRKVEEIDGLNLTIRGLNNELREMDDILKRLNHHAGYYVKYDKEFNVIDVKEFD